MESDSHYAWGESCPVYIPAYSAEAHHRHFHTVREHMAPRIIGRRIDTAQDLLDRIAFIKGNQFARAALDIAWWVLDAKRRGCRCTSRSAGRATASRSAPTSACRTPWTS